MTSALTAKFHTPPQDLAAPTLFAASGEAVAAWLESLPKTSLGPTTRALYHALTELNRVRLTPLLRLQLLEILRPGIYHAAAGLRRHYLGQPIVLPEQAQKVAQLAHVLFEQLATGYILVATHTIAQGKQSGFSQPRQAVATAVHRAIVEHSQNLLRDCQLYRSPHPGCWYTLHQLALLARDYEIDQLAIADQQCGDSTLAAVYLRALLLGSAKTYQLRQDDLPKMFQHLLDWAAAASLAAPEQALLVFNPAGDDGPIYREFATEDHTWLGLQTHALARALQFKREALDAGADERDLSSDLLGHLIHTWSTASKRAFLRIEVNERVDIAIGLTTAHYFASGEADFNTLLSDANPQALSMENDNVFLRQRSYADSVSSGPRDVWDSAYQPSSALTQVSLETIDFHIREHAKSNGGERDKFRSHTVNRINISAAGLCVKWPPDNSSQVRTGEIVGIRENSHKNWSIGVIRWLRLLDSGPQLGIELLSPTAAPYGARVLQKAGELGDYLRVLVLPEMKQTGQPTTLITPRLPFRTGQKVSLMYRDKETRIQLTRKVASTAAFSQFEFRRLSGIKASADVTAATHRDSSFDSLWDNL